MKLRGLYAITPEGPGLEQKVRALSAVHLEHRIHGFEPLLGFLRIEIVKPAGFGRHQCYSLTKDRKPRLPAESSVTCKRQLALSKVCAAHATCLP